MLGRSWAPRALSLVAFAVATASCTALVGIDHDYTLALADGGADASTGPSDATTNDQTSPLPDATFPADAGAVTKVAAGRFHTCALFGGSGVAKCWGRNDDYYELGDGTMESTAVPVYSLTPGLTDLFLGAHDSCGVLSSAGECAGKGGLGELADQMVDADSPVPEPTTALPSPPTAIASGEAFTCAIVASGDVWCVGDGTLGQLGDGNLVINASAVKALLGGPAKKLAAFYQHACALLGDGTVACWGDDSTGGVGDGNMTTTGVATPVVVAGLPHAIDVGVGDGFSCALVDTPSPGVWCWGDDSYGELGIGSHTGSATPMKVNGAAGASMLAVGGGHACAAFVNTGGISCWGHGTSGELGNDDSSDSPVPVGVSNIGGYPESLAVGGFHTCALFASPDVRCWGSDDFGQLGDGTTNQDEPTPVQVKW